MISDDSKTDRDDPTVDFIIEDSDVVLVLTLSMGGVWNPEFRFNLLPVGLEKTDVLEAQLRDAQEEIESLKSYINKRETIFLSLCSQETFHHNQYVVWNGTAPRELNEEYFQIDAQNQEVTILKNGVYQVYVRLGGANTGNETSLCLLLNSADFAKCDANGNTSQFTELMRLKIGDKLYVRCLADGDSLAESFTNRFTILLIGDL